MDEINPATKQYWIFSGIVSLIVSAILNFGVLNLFAGTIIYGFPFNFGDSVGLTNFFLKLVDTLIVGAILTPGAYYFLQWLQKRR